MIDVSRFARRAALLAAIGVAAALPASAHPDDEVAPGQVVERLHHMGFLDWRGLKFRHGFWKVDDARRANGHIYDLKVEDGSFDLVKLDRENP